MENSVELVLSVTPIVFSLLLDDLLPSKYELEVENNVSYADNRIFDFS